MKQHLQITRGRGVSDEYCMRWVLQRLPADLAALRAMGNALRHQIGHCTDRGDGLDRQCSGTVTQHWISSAPVVTGKRSMWDIFARDQGGVLGVPIICCHSCGGFLAVRATPGPRADRCLDCIRADRRARYRRRKAQF